MWITHVVFGTKSLQDNQHSLNESNLSMKPTLYPLGTEGLIPNVFIHHVNDN